jgi:molecular chaperone IbpA
MAIDPFNTSLKSFGIGFDSVLKQIEQAKEMIDTSFKNAPGYPPFNVKKTDENHYIIEMAVAGFGKNTLDIETANGVLTVTGKIESDVDSGQYLYKGIADRAFSRKFALADTMEIKNAEMVNGMLKVYLENFIPDSKKPRKVNINDGPVDVAEEVKSAVGAWFGKDKEVA